MGFLGGGGGGKPPPPPPLPPPAPIKVQPVEKKSEEDLKEQLRRARSRAKSNVTGTGLLIEDPNTMRPLLSDLL